jgi:dUTP pyrophosphatase
MIISIKRLESSQGLNLPSYATSQSAGMDLIAANYDDIVLKPFARTLVPTGICIDLPEGFEAQVRPRSGLAIKNGISVLNSPGTIDPDYRGEISVILINLSQEDFIIKRSTRIAQLVIAKFEKVVWQEADELSTTERNKDGFGSTGIK